MTPHTPHSPSQTRFPHQFHSRFPMAQSQMTQSVKPFIPAVVTQKQFELVPLWRDPQQKSTWAFTPSQSTHAQVSLSIHLADVTGLQSPWLSKRLAILSSCRVSQCPFTWLVSPIFVPFVISTTHGLLCQARTQSSICISTCVLNPATWTRWIPQHR